MSLFPFKKSKLKKQICIFLNIGETLRDTIVFSVKLTFRNTFRVCLNPHITRGDTLLSSFFFVAYMVTARLSFDNQVQNPCMQIIVCSLGVPKEYLEM